MISESAHLMFKAALSSSSAIMQPETICHATTSLEAAVALLTREGDGEGPRAEA
jgi:hypothetical protein